MERAIQLHETSARLRTLVAWLVFAAGFGAVALTIFQPAIGADSALLASDNNIGQLANRKAALPRLFLGAWRTEELAGFPIQWPINWTGLGLWVLPIDFFSDWFWAIDLWLGSLFLALFLRDRRMSWPACAVAALTAYWLGSNLTLVYAGHIGKFAVLMFASLFLWLCQRAMLRASPAWAILAGGAFGGMFLEQADIALFFALILGPYALFLAWRHQRLSMPSVLRLPLPLFAVAFLIALHPLLSGYRTYVRGVANLEQRTAQSKWEFATQWSWPPEETIDFVLPGFTGWRTGEPTGPYVGRMGRSAGWETTGSGFRNFKLENQYLGAIPVSMAVWAVLLAVVAGRREDGERADVICLAVLASIAFLLSCGKHLPFYQVFHQLPVVSSIRNPNKFLQVVQLVLAVLAAYGVDMLSGTRGSTYRDRTSLRFRRAIAIAFAAGTALLGLWWLGAMVSHPAIAARMAAEGWPHPETIADVRVRAIGHGTFMLAAAAAAVGLLAARRTAPSRWMVGAVAAGLVALTVADAVLLSRNYIRTIPTAPLRSNPLVTFLKPEAGRHRIALTDQGGFYNQWLSILFPYHSIDTANLAAAPRLPSDYEQFLSHIGRHPIRYWQLSGVRHVLAPAPVWGQLQAHPATSNAFALVYAYNVKLVDNEFAQAVPADADHPGRHGVLALRRAHGRYTFTDSWEVVGDAQVFATMTAPAYEPLRQVLIAPDPAPDIVPLNRGQGMGGEVELLGRDAGGARLRVTAPVDGFVRVAEKFHPSWRARVNGKPAPILRCDAIFQCVPVKAGISQVELSFRQPLGSLWFELAGLLACAGALGWMLYAHRRARRLGPVETGAYSPPPPSHD